MCISRTPEETAALGEAWGAEAAPGWVFALRGELGVGKTQLVRGLARGLGYEGRVHSPTFALLNCYHGGRLNLHHLDLYRLSGPDEVLRSGLEEYLYPGRAVAVVEWPEPWLGSGEPGPLPGVVCLRRAQIIARENEVREISYEDFGA